MLVDAHCHLESYKEILIPKDILPVCTGYSHTSNIKTVEIAKKYSFPFALGIAPQSAQKQGIKEIDSWVDFIKNSKPHAVGEIGLDNHWAENPDHKKTQRIAFERMIETAEYLKVPVILHSRDAESEIVDLLIEMKFKNRIMMHFYSGDEKTAKKVVELNGLISVPPLRSKQRRNVIKDTPIDNLVIETDSPYVGRTMESVRDSLDYICEVKNLSKDEVGEKTAKNILDFLCFKR